jgi:hypothetical protein
VAGSFLFGVVLRDPMTFVGWTDPRGVALVACVISRGVRRAAILRSRCDRRTRSTHGYRAGRGSEGTRNSPDPLIPIPERVPLPATRPDAVDAGGAQRVRMPSITASGPASATDDRNGRAVLSVFAAALSASMSAARATIMPGCRPP